MSKERTADGFVLQPPNATSKVGRGPPTDYHVRYGSKLICRIMWGHYAPPDPPWTGSINALERRSRPPEKCQGYAADLDSAMDAFLAAWQWQQNTGDASEV